MFKKILLAVTLIITIGRVAHATEPTFQKEIGWYSFRDLSSDAFSEKFDQFKNSGYWMIDLDCYETSSGVKYSMVWEKNTGNRGWFEYRNMTDDAYHTKWTELKDDGYRPVDIESY